jgi:hypothetical protein
MNETPKGLALNPEAFQSPSQPSTSNIGDLRLSQDFQDMIEVAKLVTTVTTGKPNQHVFFRAHPEWSGLFWMLELKQAARSEFYIVDIKAVPDLASEVTPRLLVPLITRDGALYVYPLRIATPERKLDQAGKSAQAAMQQAKTSWVRMSWNGREHEVRPAKAQKEEPAWPDVTFDGMLEIAFVDRIINSLEHPAVQALNGE